MKINFYAVYQEEDRTHKKQSIDLLGSLNEQVINLKNHALAVDDYFVFAHHIAAEVFLITKTFDSELVKRINRKTLSVDEIKDALNSDESLCFPSFLFIRENIIGFANTLYGPRARDLATYLSNKCELLHGYKLKIEPLMRDVSKDDAMDMQFIGRTTLRIESGSNLLSSVLRSVGVQTIEEELLDEIEITLKPKRSRNIKTMSQEIISSTDDNHSNILLKGKNEAADMLTDYYLSNKGHLSANIYKSSNAEIAEEMESCYIKMKAVILNSYNNIIGNDLTK